MFDFNINLNINIKAPELAEAINNLAKVFMPMLQSKPAASEPTPQAQPVVNVQPQQPAQQQPVVNVQSQQPVQQQPIINVQSQQPASRQPVVNVQAQQPVQQQPVVNVQSQQPVQQQPVVNAQPQQPTPQQSIVNTQPQQSTQQQPIVNAQVQQPAPQPPTQQHPVQQIVLNANGGVQSLPPFPQSRGGFTPQVITTINSAPVKTPTYSIAEIVAAGKALIDIDPNNMDRLNQILQNLNVHGLQNLTPEQIPTVVNALRGLGARL